LGKERKVITRRNRIKPLKRGDALSLKAACKIFAQVFHGRTEGLVEKGA